MKRIAVIALALIVNIAYAQTPPNISSTSAIADLNESIKLIDAVHFSPYMHKDSAEFHLEKDALIADISTHDSISICDFIIDVKQLIAKLNDGHTTLSLIFPEIMTAAFFPEKVVADLSQGIIYQKSETESKSIRTINGHNAYALFQESMTLYGGNENFRKAMSQSMIFPIYLYLKDIQAPFVIEYTDGSTSTIEHTMDIRTLASRQGSNMDDYSFEVLPNQIGYLAYNNCNDAKAFEKFLKNTFKRIADENIDKLIIDIRENTGGTSSLNDLLIPYFSRNPYRQSSTRHWRVSKAFQNKISDPVYIGYWGKSFVEQYAESPVGTILKEDAYGLTKPKKPKHYFEGKSCMLIGPKTFSSANFLADAVATYQLTTLIGEATGEDTNDFGEQVSFALPNTGLALQVTLAYDIGADGDSEKIEPVHPDIEIADDALPYAIEWLQKVN